MSLPGAATDLSQGWKTVNLAWEAVRAGWDDPVSRDFEANHFEPLQSQVLAAVQAMERLAPVLARALRECSD